MKKIAALVINCLILAAVTNAQSNPATKLPSIILKDISGKTVSLNQYKGKIVLLNFWATWCPPCRAEIPELIKWQREYQRQGLQIVGVTYPPTNLVKVRSFARRMKINYPILLGSKKTKAFFDSGEVMPLTVIIDEEGNVREYVKGILFPEEFDERVKPLLRFDKGNLSLY